MEKTFNRRSQLYRYLRNVAAVLDDCYNTTYHLFDINIDIDEFDNWYKEMIKSTKGPRDRYDLWMTIGVRKQGVSRNLEDWGDKILFTKTFGYDAETGMFVCK